MNLPLNKAFGPWFEAADVVRRAHGEGLAMLGFGPAERGHRVIAMSPLWRLRRYAGPEGGSSVLIVAAPIKRPYIWDLAPSVSAVRFCLGHGLRVHLLEWVPPTPLLARCGLAEYACDAISKAVAAAADEDDGAKPFLMGHSLGGTLATVFAALHPESLSGLVLLSAPLCFAPGSSAFRDAIARMSPSWLSDMEIVPGSLLSQLSAAASPQTFVWSRLQDAAASAADPRAWAVRARIERWAMDEISLAGALVREIFLWLYRDNRLCKGTLAIRGRVLRPDGARLPILAVANAIDEIAPPASVTPFLEATSEVDTRLIAYPGEPGVVLQHLGILVGRSAYASIWPEIVSWVKDHSGSLGLHGKVAAAGSRT